MSKSKTMLRLRLTVLVSPVCVCGMCETVSVKSLFSCTCSWFILGPSNEILWQKSLQNFGHSLDSTKIMYVDGKDKKDGKKDEKDKDHGKKGRAHRVVVPPAWIFQTSCVTIFRHSESFWDFGLVLPLYPHTLGV